MELLEFSIRVGLAALEMYKELAVVCVIIISINYTFGILERKLLQKERSNLKNKRK